MLADPLRDIGLRRHHALVDRAVPGELKRLLLAIVGIGDGANGQDDFNQTVLHSKHASAIIRPNSSLRFKLERKLSGRRILERSNRCPLVVPNRKKIAPRHRR